MSVTAETVFDSELTSLGLLHRGKVRDIYTVDDAHMLIVASDRLSAFDVVLPDPIPGKGAVLTDLSLTGTLTKTMGSRHVTAGGSVSWLAAWFSTRRRERNPRMWSSSPRRRAPRCASSTGPTQPALTSRFWAGCRTR